MAAQYFVLSELHLSSVIDLPESNLAKENFSLWKTKYDMKNDKN